jgi:hypothetical protein
MTLVVPGDSSATILIAVDDQLTQLPPAIVQLDDGSLASASPKDVLDKLTEVGQRVALVCQSVYERAKEEMGEMAPNELTLEFGVTLGGSAGVPFVSHGKAEGTFKVTAKWTRP